VFNVDAVDAPFFGGGDEEVDPAEPITLGASKITDAAAKYNMMLLIVFFSCASFCLAVSCLQVIRRSARFPVFWRSGCQLVFRFSGGLAVSCLSGLAAGIWLVNFFLAWYTSLVYLLAFSGFWYTSLVYLLASSGFFWLFLASGIPPWYIFWLLLACKLLLAFWRSTTVWYRSQGTC